MNVKQNTKVLIVEDEFITASALKLMLGGMGFEIIGWEDSGEGAIKAAEELKPDIILMDIILSGEMNGISAANIIRQKLAIPVIYLTGQTDDSTIAQALGSEPFGYIVKPFEEKNLKTTIKMALYKHELEQKLSESERRYRAIAELSNDPIFICNPDYSVIYVNTYGIQFFQLNPGNKKTVPLSNIFPEDLGEQLKKHLDSVIRDGKFQRFSLHGFHNEDEFWLDTILVPVRSSDNTIIQVIGHSRDITIQMLFEKDMKLKGLSQIERNMEQFQILNDKIRNPLAIIMAVASIHENKENDTILEQVDIVNNLVNQLDHGWIESEKVRTFLIKHYGHGNYLCD